VEAITVSEARATLPDVLDRVSNGEEVTITRYGRPIAVVVRPDALRSRRAQRVLAEAEQLHDVLEEARGTSLSDEGLSADRAEELVKAIRASRRAR
jgi:prevent-host-death family protein